MSCVVMMTIITSAARSERSFPLLLAAGLPVTKERNTANAHPLPLLSSLFSLRNNNNNTLFLSSEHPSVLPPDCTFVAQPSATSRLAHARSNISTIHHVSRLKLPSVPTHRTNNGRRRLRERPARLRRYASSSRSDSFADRTWRAQ